MDRVAFMQQYTPMYEREKARDMTPGELTTQIDAVAASLPDKGQKKLADRESDRRKAANSITPLFLAGTAGRLWLPRIRWRWKPGR